MPCIKAPPLSLPSLPPGLSFKVTLPSASFDPKLCCKLLPFPIPALPLPSIPGVPVNPVLAAAMAAARRALIAYVDQLQISCPKE